MSRKTKTKSKKKSGSGRFILILLLGVLAFCGWRIHQTGAVMDESAACGALESKVNAILSQYHVQERDIVRVVRLEKKSKIPHLFSWVETEREFLLPAKAPLEEMAETVQSAAEENKLEFHSRRASPDKIHITLGKHGRIYQSLLFMKKRP